MAAHAPFYNTINISLRVLQNIHVTVTDKNAFAKSSLVLGLKSRQDMGEHNRTILHPLQSHLSKAAWLRDFQVSLV